MIETCYSFCLIIIGFVHIAVYSFLVIIFPRPFHDFIYSFELDYDCLTLLYTIRIKALTISPHFVPYQLNDA